MSKPHVDVKRQQSNQKVTLLANIFLSETVLKFVNVVLQQAQQQMNTGLSKSNLNTENTTTILELDDKVYDELQATVTAAQCQIDQKHIYKQLMPHLGTTCTKCCKSP